MPKIKWAQADKDQALSAADIDSAQADAAYAGELPPPGVYRFTLKKSKVKTFGTGNMGFENRLVLDGSWKDGHAEFDGAPLWDRVILTKAGAAFVKAFQEALGVTAADITSNVVVDTEGTVTAIGKKKIDGQDLQLYINVKRDPNPEYSARLDKAGTGYIKVDAAQAASAPAESEEDDAPKGKRKGLKKGKKAKGDSEPPF